MSKYIDAEKLVAEIERLKKQVEILSPLSSFQRGQITGYRQLLSFIESLEKEQPVLTKEETIAMLRLEYEKGRADTIAEMANAPKIKGWVARDKSEDGLFGKGLCVHFSKPERNGDCWSAFTIMTHLPWEMFPHLKFTDEPIEVELTLNRI